MGFLGYKKEVLQIKTAINNCSKYNEWPIRMEENTGRVYLDHSPKTRIVWSIQCSLCLVLLLATILCLLAELQSDVVSIPQLIFIQLLIVIHAIPVYCNVAFYFNGDSFVSVLNMAIPFFQSYNVSNEQVSPLKAPKSLALLFKVLRYLYMANAYLLCVVMLVRMYAKESILSALPAHWGQMWLMRCTVAFLYAVQYRSLALVAGFLTVHIFAISIWTTRTLKSLRRIVESANYDGATLKRTLSVYTKLCIITREFNKSIAIVLPAYKLAIISAIFATYAVVKLHGVVVMFCAVYAVDTTAALEFCLNIFADLHCESGAYLKCMRSRVSRRTTLGKQVKAAAHAGIKVGGHLYFVDKIVMLVVLHIIVSNTVTFMLAT